MKTVTLTLDLSDFNVAVAALSARADETRRKASKVSDAGLRSLLNRQAASFERSALNLVEATTTMKEA